LSPAEDSNTEPPTTDDTDLFLDPRILGSVVVVYGERPNKPFERETHLRLSGDELQKNGVVHLAQALSLLPDLYVREAGRGGQQIDIRGARKGSVRILIDGIAVSDPYYGNLDLSSIPVTDIEQIRVSTSPASPIDGPGGPGGVVEIHTRDAYASEMLLTRVQATSLPSATASATGRTMLSKHFAARISTTAAYGSRDFELVMPDDTTVALDEARRQSVGALRLEYQRGDRRVVTDLYMQQHGFVVPPQQDGSSSILAIDGEAQGRMAMSITDRFGPWKLQGTSHYQTLFRDSTYYDDPQLMSQARSEELSARRTGANLLANRGLSPALHAIASATIDSEHASVEGFDGVSIAGRATVLQAAAGLQYKRKRLQANVSGGLAVPVGLGAKPWPELKASSRLESTETTQIELTVGHKGRVPTLRERFRMDIGNPSLGPERVLFAEAITRIKIGSHLTVQSTSYVRRTNGQIRFNGERQALINTETMDVRGIENRLDLRYGALSSGLAYNFSDVFSEALGTDSLDFFPRHRGDAYLTLRQRLRGVNGRIRYLSSQIDRSQRLPAVALLEGSVFHELPRKILLTLRVENALDHRYQNRAGVFAPGRTIMLIAQSQWQ
jgi:outer membrane receptor protein involved in Fe transport